MQEHTGTHTISVLAQTEHTNVQSKFMDIITINTLKEGRNIGNRTNYIMQMNGTQINTEVVVGLLRLTSHWGHLLLS